MKRTYDILFLTACTLWMTSCFAQTVSVTVRVTVPKSTPDTARIFIAGNDPSLGDWNPGGVELQKESDSVWARSFEVPRGFSLEFKITRGNWNTQAIFNDGTIPPNIGLLAIRDTSVLVRPKTWSDFGMAPGGRIVGTVEYVRGLKGEGLQYDRDLIVWLPPSYKKGLNKRYPVLYMHDGQNVFDPSTSFIGYDWHVDDVADSLIRAGVLNEIIVVGIYNSPDRIPEYSDTDLGRRYAEFVVGKVKPLIDSTYRTLPDREHTVVMGSSMGGLISFLFVWWYPDVFSKAGCLSSAFLRDRTRILDAVENDPGPRRSIHVYMDCGGNGLEVSLKPGMDEMSGLLEKKGYVRGVDFETFFDEKADHSERSWAGRVWRPLMFMFGKSEVR
ncbi:MAG: alpha/beta hydrolase-fold protein [Bacteroidota bacterium]